MLDLTQAPYFLSQKQVKQVKNMVEKMSLEAKIGQLFFIIGPDEANIEEFISRYQPGGIMYRPDNALKIINEINSAQNYSEVPLFIAANLESGGNGLLKEGTWVGNPLQIAATDDPSYAFELGKIGGAEAKQVGGNMAFAPIVDLDLNFRNPIMNTRTFGSSLQRVLSMSEAETKGFKSQG
ncbi:MAG: glycoside hydrolase family 3 N-terminal domain-containing protein, partial [Lactobacillaceae bacterium]